MSRIYLKKHNDNSFWIKDILDDKKLGIIKVKNGKYKYSIKNKLKGHLLKSESLLLIKHKSKLPFQQEYKSRLQKLNHKWTNLDDYKFPMFVEACRLKQCENDLFNRPTWLHPTARKAWKKMKAAAKTDSINLKIISAFRSLDYQKQLIENKIKKGISIEEILKVNTLPGFSEHHTGCAIDIGAKGAAVLEAEFDQSPAFSWLMNNANTFNFYLTYPKDNSTGIMYEPWHWCFKKDPTQK